LKNQLRIESVSLSAFRGIREKLVLDLSAPLTLIYAPNGTGKTTVCDGVEWLLTGNVERLGARADELPELLRCQFSESLETAVGARLSVGGGQGLLLRDFESCWRRLADEAEEIVRPAQLLEWIAPSGAQETANATAAINSRRNWLRGTRILSGNTLALLLDNTPEHLQLRQQVFADLLGVGSLLETEKKARSFQEKMKAPLRERERRLGELARSVSRIGSAASQIRRRLQLDRGS